ncbi:hypothetical protein LTR64_000129 [Lithohypha guttulata]|uniref:uncharacterized protein n=1 Tax=Lithohypha guttulata TaxID=1690604 RepID=UPI002DE1C458|nr:hypothetical protein LTR51_007491 [Lithohypha guttulata]
MAPQGRTNLMNLPEELLSQIAGQVLYDGFNHKTRLGQEPNYRELFRDLRLVNRHMRVTTDYELKERVPWCLIEIKHPRSSSRHANMWRTTYTQNQYLMLLQTDQEPPYPPCIHVKLEYTSALNDKQETVSRRYLVCLTSLSILAFWIDVKATFVDKMHLTLVHKPAARSTQEEFVRLGCLLGRDLPNFTSCPPLIGPGSLTSSLQRPIYDNPGDTMMRSLYLRPILEYFSQAKKRGNYHEMLACLSNTAAWDTIMATDDRWGGYDVPTQILQSYLHTQMIQAQTALAMGSKGANKVMVVKLLLMSLNLRDRDLGREMENLPTKAQFLRYIVKAEAYIVAAHGHEDLPPSKELLERAEEALFFAVWLKAIPQSLKLLTFVQGLLSRDNEEQKHKMDVWLLSRDGGVSAIKNIHGRALCSALTRNYPLCPEATELCTADFLEELLSPGNDVVTGTGYCFAEIVPEEADVLLDRYEPMSHYFRAP